MVYLVALFSPLKNILISTAPILQEVEPVGRWFEAYVSRNRKNISLSNSEPDEHSEENDKDNKESSSSSSDSEDERYLLTLDPKEWKVMTSAIVI
jgi:DnaJ family protein C protein 2